MARCPDSTCRPCTVGRSRQRGIALLLVLWVIALLTIIAVGLSATQRTETALAGNQVSSARFRALADAAVDYAMLNMTVQPIAAQGTQDQVAQWTQDQVVPEQEDLWVPDGTPHTWGFAGETIEIAVSNEASRIDLNQAPRGLLVGLFTAAQVPDDEVNALADAVIDWRDPDDLRSADGAEDSDYEAAGRPYGAKDGPFDSVEELQQVLGFTHQLYRVLEPALTVATGSAQVVQDFASPLVIAALQGISEEEARDRQQEQQAAEGVPGAAGPTGASLNRGGPLYRIRVTLHQGRGASPSMEVLVRTGGGGRVSTGTAAAMGSTPAAHPSAGPFRILWRRYGILTEPEPVQGS